MGAPTATCPSCGERGRQVSDATVEHLVSGQRPTALVGRALFCSSGSCDVVYFEPAGATVEKSAVRVPVFQKETDPSRPVCYCFEHTVAEVRAAEKGDGSNRIVDAIMRACRAGLDRCEVTNPQGRCCLGNVRAAAKAVPVSEASPCCSGDSE